MTVLTNLYLALLSTDNVPIVKVSCQTKSGTFKVVTNQKGTYPSAFVSD